MYPYIRCFCGRPLGEIYDLFKAMRYAECQRYFESNETETVPDYASFNEDVQVVLRPVFERLKINTSCCRARLMTHVDFAEYY